ncbi:hypothetical protein BJX99DRAFT_266865, partial [Aspergillus californicus]
MISPLTLLTNFLSAIGLLKVTTTPTSYQTLRPTYAIAHRVLRPEAVTAALSHGANALEIDLTAWDTEWWADHDGTAHSAGATARTLFQTIASQRQNGQNIIFVWLDIKNPDHCKGADRGCSIEALRDLVRETLEPAGVKALYGFFQTETSDGFTVMRETLGGNEAIVLSGTAGEVVGLYDDTGISARQRIMDYGYSRLDQGFGNCHELSYYTCAELREGGGLREDGRLGKVMGWTSTRGDTQRVDLLLQGAEVDGVIYGFQSEDYADDAVPKAAFQDIQDFVDAHSDTRRMANVEDAPW